jgi:hypothetical protein
MQILNTPNRHLGGPTVFIKEGKFSPRLFAALTNDTCAAPVLLNEA